MAIVVLGLAACGQAGPLVLPEPASAPVENGTLTAPRPQAEDPNKPKAPPSAPAVEPGS